MEKPTVSALVLNGIESFEKKVQAEQAEGIYGKVTTDKAQYGMYYKNLKTGEPMSPEEHQKLIESTGKKREHQKQYAMLGQEVKKRTHLRVLTDKTKEIKLNMTAKTLGMMMMILGETKWMTEDADRGLLVKDGQPMRVKDFAQLFGKSQRPTMTILKELDDAGFLIRRGETASVKYYINPEFNIMGKSIAQEGNFTRLYHEDIKELMSTERLVDGEMKRLSPEALGYFYKLMAFMSLNFNCLAHNPEETDKANLKLIFKKDLPALTNTSRPSVTKYLNELNTFGVIGEFKLYGNKSLIPNPKYAFRGDNYETYRQVTEAFSAIANKMDQQEETQ